LNRSELRAILRERRRAIPVRERLDAAAALASHLLPELAALHASGNHGRIAGYWAVGGELPLHAVQSALPAGLRWCLPVLHDDGRLRFCEWAAGQPLEPNRLGIPEPTQGPLLDADALAVVLVPLLAFDARGNRLGQGGGWYDRSFDFLCGSSQGLRGSDSDATRRTRGAPLLIGIGYDGQQVDELPAEPWDVPLDAVATPSAFHRFDRHATASP
jgi:5-formyltetrahydrofolate cyclo-ligase